MSDNNIYQATVQYTGDDFFIGTAPSGNVLLMDASSERKAAVTPLEMLLVAVAGCTAYDVQSILKKKRQDVTGYKVEVTGVRREEMPRYFTSYHLKHIVTGRGVSEKAVADAIELSDTKYCSVAGAVKGRAEVTTSFEIIEEPGN